MRIGIHTSIAKSLEGSARKAAELGANTFQIFSASPRMWRAGAPKREDCERLQAAREELDLFPLVVHGSYLLNLASVEPVTRERSIAAFRAELERCVAIGAEYLVVHPGNYKGQEIEAAMGHFVDGVAEAARGVGCGRLTLLLECTAGSGAALGSKLEELRFMRELAGQRTELPVAYCLDTAHLHAAGYDLATPKGSAATLKSIESTLGFDNVKVFHANDSKAALGTRVDRHEHIGLGHIGEAGFRRLLRHPVLKNKPFLLETPLKEDGDDVWNIQQLRSLCQRSRTTTA